MKHDSWREGVTMVHGYHVIFGTYGFWLPNDPRGSWSDFVASWELFRYGPATKTDSRRSVASDPHDHALRLAAKSALKYPPVVLTGRQALSAAQGFAESARKSNIVIWACAILPEHVHLVLARHRFKVETMVNQLKGKATKRLKKDGLHPLIDHPKEDGTLPSPWGESQWKVYLDSVDDIVRAVDYVGDNPEKEGKRRQNWSFVTPFEGLPET